jgi:hypothetical protein
MVVLACSQSKKKEEVFGFILMEEELCVKS